MNKSTASTPMPAKSNGRWRMEDLENIPQNLIDIVNIWHKFQKNFTIFVEHDLLKIPVEWQNVCMCILCCRIFNNHVQSWTKIPS